MRWLLHNKWCYIKDPLLASNHFEKRWKAFLKYILKSKTPSFWWTFWTCLKELSTKIEEALMCVWIENAETLKEISEANITRFINQTIIKHLPSEQSDKVLHHLVKKFQTHHHSKSCSRNVCRFGFLRSVFEKILIT